MTVTMFRVDDRLIHGQTITRWAVERPVYGILVISNDVANDDLRKRVLRAAAGSKKIGIYTEEQGLDKVKKAIETDRNYYVISDSPIVFTNLIQKGVEIKDHLNVGPISSGKDKQNVARNVSLSQEEFDAFEYLKEQGINIQFQLIPTDDVKTWDTIKKKYKTI